ncbi:hypothetical protein C1645_821946 [Glomus cerebriforme]|uniref:Uncharacterized protein n=1 Tax=Glomus cerebriforme TaxID=658196 RepID=A0A397T137_9GLOM|nr:hypothetical protein C1645_821946 [Glomus cerebriforme]
MPVFPQLEIDRSNEYIIATMDLSKGTPVYNIPAEYKGFSVLVDYGVVRASSDQEQEEQGHQESDHQEHRTYQS